METPNNHTPPNVIAAGLCQRNIKNIFVFFHIFIYFNFCMLNFEETYKHAGIWHALITRHWAWAGNWNFTLWATKTCLSYIVNTTLMNLLLSTSGHRYDYSSQISVLQNSQTLMKINHIANYKLHYTFSVGAQGQKLVLTNTYQC